MSRVDNSSSGSLKRGTQLTGSVFIGRQVPFLNKDSKYITYIYEDGNKSVVYILYIPQLFLYDWGAFWSTHDWINILKIKTGY